MGYHYHFIPAPSSGLTDPLTLVLDGFGCFAGHSRAFAVRLHSAGLSLRETVAILDLLGVDRSHGAVWDWTHRLADSQNDPPRSEWSAKELNP